MERKREDSEAGRRICQTVSREEKRKEWAKHWQCHTEVPNPEDTLWSNEELKNLEKGRGFFESDHEKAARNYKAKAGVGCDGLHPKVPLDFERESRGEVVEFLEKVEQCGRWSQQACTTS